MSYFTGAVTAVPTTNKQKYAEHIAAMWPLFKSYGAIRMVDTWGADVPKGKITDFYGAVDAKGDEAIVFSWMEWPDKATADASWNKMMNDPAMKQIPEMPFDGSRMIFGGFSPVYQGGDCRNGDYYQGFLLAVPEKNKAAYVKMAEEGWKMLENHGAKGMVENWGADVPRGEKTDFYRAVKAEDGEVVLFSWITWPNRAKCDAAAKAMEAEWSNMDTPPEMPFDGMRMMWAGFEPLFNSEKAAERIWFTA